MNKFIRHATWLLVAAAVTPLPASAQNFLGIEFSTIELTALASVATQLEPIKVATDSGAAPKGTPESVAALGRARGIPFPNLPNSVGSAFASSAANNDGVFGVGVNGFFFTNSLPPDALLASATYRQTITNHSSVSVSLFADVTVPVPTIQLFGIGDFFPAGADPRRDVTARVNASFLTHVIHADGSTADGQPLDYGISVFREPISGKLFGIDADGAVLARFEEPDGSFGFQLPNLHEENLALGEIGPGDTVELTLDYFASASTGFGETGVFAAIGDPFALNAGIGNLNLQVGVLTPVPEPGAWAVLAGGLLALRFGARAAARRQLRGDAS
jgi:hypothetical protein